MRVLYSHRTRGVRAEGAHIAGICDALRELGHSVEILSPPGVTVVTLADAQHGSGDKSTQGNPEVHKSRARKMEKYSSSRVPELLFAAMEVLYNAIALFRTWRKLRTGRFDLIYERYSMFLFVNVWLARVYSVPIVLEINDSCLVERIRPLKFAGLSRTIEKWVFRNTTLLSFISGTFQEIAEREYGDIAHSVVCPNAVNEKQFNNSVDGQQLRRQLGLEDAVVCGYFGVFAPWHGIGWFVREAGERILHNKDSQHPTFLLIGDGLLHEELVAWVHANELQSHFVFTGRVPHTDIPEYIAAMDYGVLPESNAYGSPMKLIESMAMGVPLVAPDLGPIREVVAHNETGWIFEAFNHDSALDMVWRMSEDMETIRRVGAAASSYIRTHRLWTNNAQTCLDAALASPSSDS